MPRILFTPANSTVSVPAGVTVLEAARAADVDIITPCGGRGKCGKCRVRVIEGRVETGETDEQAHGGGSDGWVLACTARVGRTDLIVDVPEKAVWHAGDAEDPSELLKPFSSDHLPVCDRLDRSVEAITLTVATSERDERQSDFARVRSALAALDLESAEFPLTILRGLAEALRLDEGRITLVVERRENHTCILDVISGHVCPPLYGLAVDIGTTNIAVLIVSLREGAILACEADYNDQVVCGLDLISRINYAGRENGLTELHSRVVETINRLTRRACKVCQIQPCEVVAAAVSGNTTMTHLFLGLTPKYIRLEPYSPTILAETPEYRAGRVGLVVNRECHVHLSPSVGSYIGGDIAAGIPCTGLTADSEDICLYMDIGTNGELVVGNRDLLISSACSAGSALEGMDSECGMRAAEGAIKECSLDGDTGRLSLSVIGEGRPLGICGAGLVS
ncbi:MAG: DUF4445 domain-containing protein, partial [Chitinivibrionales bacterium]|nr:DUF4445 domain-containing protein [Chitinivibrionales bacterium]MBD3357025.1 DUF4445 domain-containing protein [Chitinivibrionales bacterium]